jgi:Zn-dependent protease with chaperone function
MLNIWMKKLKSLWKFLVKYWILILIIVGTVMEISDCKSRENLEKFLSINVDMKAAGIHTEELIAKLKKDPLGTRVRVENHKRKRFILITKEQEKAMGEQFVSKMKSLDILWENSVAEKRCNKILKRLTQVLPKNSHINEKIYILNTKYINAFCLPDGTITITKGALKEFNN